MNKTTNVADLQHTFEMYTNQIIWWASVKWNPLVSIVQIEWEAEAGSRKINGINGWNQRRTKFPYPFHMVEVRIMEISLSFKHLRHIHIHIHFAHTFRIKKKREHTERKTTAKQLHYHSQSPFLIDIRIIMFVKRILCDISPLLVVHFLPHSRPCQHSAARNQVVFHYSFVLLFVCLFVLNILHVHFYFTPIFLFFQY